MGRLLTWLMMLLLLLCGMGNRASAKALYPENIASGGLGGFGWECVWETGPQAFETQWETSAFPAWNVLDVCYGPNVYTYVRQNPWTMFDPLGLRTLGGIPDNPEEAEHDRAELSKVNEEMEKTRADLSKLEKAGPGRGRAGAAVYMKKRVQLQRSLNGNSARADFLESRLEVYEKLNTAGWLMGTRGRVNADRFVMSDTMFRACYPDYAGPPDPGIKDFSGEAFAIATMFTPGTSLRMFGAANTTTRWGPATGAGPLGEKVAATFRGGSYTEMVTSEATTLYRVYGGKSGQLGSYWTRTAPGGPMQSQLDSALLTEWGGTASNVVKIQVPKGTTIFDGFAAPQTGTLKPFENLMGGGSQVYIPKVDPSWIVK